MAPRGGKGKGKGKGGGGGGNAKDWGRRGNDKPNDQRSWQCRNCKSLTNPKNAKFCGGCASKRDECERQPADSRDKIFRDVEKKFAEREKKFAEREKQLRKDFADLKKTFDQKGPNTTGGGNGGGHGGGKGGNGGGNGAGKGGGNAGKRWGNGNGKDVSCPPPGQAAAAASQGPVAANGAAASDTPSPSKPVSNYDVLVDFDEAQISLGHLHEMLESTKAYFPEGHKRIVEIRAAIDKGHQKRCQITDPEQLVPQTERNIVNKQKAIDKSISKIDELKAQRDDIDSQISNLESKLKDDQTLLEEFKQRLEQAKSRQQQIAAPTGVLPVSLDKEPGMPVLRRWMQANYVDLYNHCEHTQWKQHIAGPHADQFMQWVKHQDAINGFAKYASNRAVAELEPREVEAARGALKCILELPHRFMDGPAARAVDEYSSGIDIGEKQAFGPQCTVLLSWIKDTQVPFAPMGNKKLNRSRMSGPYLLPEEEGKDLEPINISSSYDPTTIWIDARSILRDHDATMLDCLPQPDNKRGYEFIQAAEKYAAAVVQNKDKLRRIPRFDDYIAELAPPGDEQSPEVPKGGGEGNGRQALDAMAKAISGEGGAA